MKNKSFLPVLMALCVLVSISAKAQGSGPYAFVDGSFRYTSVSTRDGSEKNNIVSQDEFTIGASLGLGYIVCPNNDGQGISVEVGFVIGTKNNYYTNVNAKSDTKLKMLGAELTFGYHLSVIPHLYYVPELSVGFFNSEPSQYVEGYKQWHTGATTHSIGVGLNLLNFEYRSNNTPLVNMIINTAKSMLGQIPYEYGGKASRPGIDKTWWTFDSSGQQSGSSKLATT